MSLPFVSLDSATSVGAGLAKDLEGSFAYHTMIVDVAVNSGDPIATVGLEGSHDGVEWRGLASVSTSAGAIVSPPANSRHVVRYVRASLYSVSNGTVAVTATIASA